MRKRSNPAAMRTVKEVSECGIPIMRIFMITLRWIGI